jgi:4-hydroxy-3-methylbut-2-enyl diphosphate reductase
MKATLANPHGFCAGVDRAIGIVEAALKKFGAPIYVRHQVVHNKHVVTSLAQKGAIFVDDLKLVPKGATLIFSAHGVSNAVREEAKILGLNIFDATCPLVAKVHSEVKRYVNANHQVILIGHAKHPEVEGTLGQVKHGISLVENIDDVRRLSLDGRGPISYVTQTTLSVDDTKLIVAALQARFPGISGPHKNDICYATQNRQHAVKRLCKDCDLILVVGSTNSSNSNRLKELAEQKGVKAFLIDGAEQVQPEWLTSFASIGVTAGASAPEVLVNQVCDKLVQLGAQMSVMSAPAEGYSFALPQGL